VMPPYTSPTTPSLNVTSYKDGDPSTVGSQYRSAAELLDFPLFRAWSIAGTKYTMIRGRTDFENRQGLQPPPLTGLPGGLLEQLPGGAHGTEGVFRFEGRVEPHQALPRLALVWTPPSQTEQLGCGHQTLEASAVVA
jgi:hypothetical protein